MQFLCYLNVLVSHCSMLCLFLSITLLILIFLNRSQGGGGLVCLFAYRLTYYLLNSLMLKFKANRMHQYSAFYSATQICEMRVHMIYHLGRRFIMEQSGFIVSKVHCVTILREILFCRVKGTLYIYVNTSYYIFSVRMFS